MKTDIIPSGMQDKYSTMKDSISSRQIHSYDYSGPYAGFRGAAIFAKELVSDLYTPAWKLVKAPWKNQAMLVGSLTGGED